MDTPNRTGSTRSNTAGDESVRITRVRNRPAFSIVDRELGSAFLHGQLSRRMGPRFRVPNKFQGLKAEAFTAGARDPHGRYELDKIWQPKSQRRGDDRDWPSVDRDDEFLDVIGAAFQDGHFFAAFGEDVLTDVLLAWRNDVDSCDPPTWPPDDEPDEAEIPARAA